STWSGDGHFPANCNHSPRQSGLSRSTAAATPHRGEAADRGRDIGARRIGGACGAGSRCERQSGVWLAPSLLGRTTWGAEARDQVAAGSGEREHVGAGRGRASRHGYFPTTTRHDSHLASAGAGANRGQRRSRLGARVAGVSAGMIALPAKTRIWIAAGVTDLRRGFTGLSGLVQTKLEQSPFSGHVFVFRGRGGDLIKVLWFDGDGLCLFAKRLERGRFVWPQATSGTVALTPAQLSMLLEGIDWRRPVRSHDPQLSV